MTDHPVDARATGPSCRLHCLGGEQAPPDLARDLVRVLELPEGAREKLWDALGPALADPLPDDVEPLLTKFCREHGIADEVLAPPLKALRFVLRAAAEVDLDRARFTEDIETLGGAAAPRLAEVLQRGFEPAKKFVRHGLAQRTLEAHGKLVERAEWRIERILASSDANKLDVTVAVVTLEYRDSGKRERITLQLLPDALAELARAHARISR